MLSRCFHSIASKSQNSILNVFTASLGLGLLAGLLVLIWIHQYITSLGTSLPWMTGTYLALAMGADIAFGFKYTIPTFKKFLMPPSLKWFSISAWIIAFPWLLSTVRSIIGLFSMETLSLPLNQLVFGWFAALCLLVLPILYVVYCSLSLKEEVLGIDYFKYLAGMSVGIILGATCIAPMCGLQILGIILSIVAFSLSLFFLSQKTPFVSQPSQQTFDSVEKSASTLPFCYQLSSMQILLLGMVFFVNSRILIQLIPAVPVLNVTLWASLMMGLAAGIGMNYYRQRAGQRQYFNDMRVMPALLSSTLLLFFFPNLTDLMLSINSSASMISGLMVARLLLVSVFCIPVGFSWGLLVDGSLSHKIITSDSNGKDIPTVISLRTFYFIMGYLITAWGVTSTRNAAGWLVVLAYCVLLINFVMRLLQASQFRQAQTLPVWKIGKRIILFIAILFFLACPLYVSNYQPARSSRLLFGTGVFVANAQGIQMSMLPYLDEGRLLQQFEGDRGTYTLWQHRGGQQQVRENGVPKAILSSSSRICPRSTSEVMHAFLPLVLHGQPGSALLLGLQGGVALNTARTFPLRDIDCCESDEALQRGLQNIWMDGKGSPLADERVRLISIHPSLALLSDSKLYDVIISSPDQTALAQSAHTLTLEYYQQVSAKLSKDGIFSQRFQGIDYGASPLLSVLQTLKSAFMHVMMVETGPAEFVVLASNSETGLKREGLVSRLQHQQRRQVLSEIGWDWTVPLNLRAFDLPAIDVVLSTHSSNHNSVINGWLAYRLPQEVIRWADKTRDFENVFAVHAGKLLQWCVNSAEEKIVLDRLAEVVGHKKLVTEYPDQWYAYRKELRKRIQDHPRSVIRMAGGIAPRHEMHSDTRRRLDYFSALGEIKQKESPTPADLEKIASFELPYDPLMSYFVHCELIKLFPNVSNSNDEMELIHRLHTIYYSDPRDRSVRNVIDAINFVCSNKTLLRAESRRDTLDGLVQMLKIRWDVRGQVKPNKVGVVLNDIDRSLEAYQNAFAELDRLEREATQLAELQLQFPETLSEKSLNLIDGGNPVIVMAANRLWKYRKRYLARTAVRPLQTYRSRLMPHYHPNKEQRQKDKLKD